MDEKYRYIVGLNYRNVDQELMIDWIKFLMVSGRNQEALAFCDTLVSVDKHDFFPRTAMKLMKDLQHELKDQKEFDRKMFFYAWTIIENSSQKEDRITAWRTFDQISGETRSAEDYEKLANDSFDMKDILYDLAERLGQRNAPVKKLVGDRARLLPAPVSVDSKSDPVVSQAHVLNL